MAANMTFKANLIPHTDAGYDLGSSSLKWNIYADDIAAAGDISTTGNLSITGNATLSGQTSAESITTGSLVVTGAATFTQTPNLPGGYLPLTGGTMTGTLKAKGSVYDDAYTGSLDMSNSNIYNVNSIYTCDVSDNAGEGIHFYRDATHVDTLWMNGGDLLFVPNRVLGTSTTKANSQKVARFTANPTSGQVVITDGTTGGIKTTGITIGKSVPSDAVFTDKYVKQSASTTATWHKVLLHCQEDAGATTAVTDSTNQVYATIGVSVQPSTNTLRAASFNVLGQVTLQFDSTTNALNFVFA